MVIDGSNLEGPGRGPIPPELLMYIIMLVSIKLCILLL